MSNERGFIRVDVEANKRGSAIETLRELTRTSKPAVSFIGVYEVPRLAGQKEIWIEYSGPSRNAYDFVREELSKKEVRATLTENKLIPVNQESK